jgi:RND family efflux transporter MFP subunit
MLSKNGLKIVLPVLLLLVGLCFAWLIMAMRPQITPQPTSMQIPLVSIITVKPQTIWLDVHSQGVVTPRNEIDLVPEVAGKVTRLHSEFVSGGFFKANDLLVTIDTRDYDAALTLAQAQIAEAQRQLAMEEAQADQARNEWQALGNGAPSALAMREPQLAEARAKLKAAHANWELARIKRSRCELRAPFSGRLQSKSIGLGQYIQPGDKIAHIYSTDVAEIRLPITLDQLGFVDLPLSTHQLALIQKPQVTLSAQIAGTKYSWHGLIVRTEDSIDASTGVVYAVAEVQSPYLTTENRPPLLSRLFVEAEIKGKQLEHIFVLPPVAINTSQQVLLVDAEQKLHIHSVEILRSEAERVLVKSGLNDGDRIIVSSIPVPVDGMTVKIENQLDALKVAGDHP